MDLGFLSVIDEKKEFLDALADAVWEAPELAFTEVRSAKLLTDALRKEGFTVREGLAGIETAFSGAYGEGRPVIGILGEFDALSGLGQEAGVPEKRPGSGRARRRASR